MPYIADPSVGFLHAGAEELARKLREGDGLVWTGDPSLELRMALLRAARTGYHSGTRRHQHKGDIVARRYEVWRHTEQGQDVLIGHWRLEEFDAILIDLVAMDVRKPGHTPLADRLDRADADKEKAKSAEFREAAGPMLEHMMLLGHDLNNPRITFRQVGGHRDNPLPEKAPDAPAS